MGIAVAEKVDVEVHVRKAEPTDVLRILAMMRDFRAGNPLVLPPVIEQDAMEWFLHVCRNGVVFLADISGGKYQGEQAGMLVVQLCACPWNQSEMLASSTLFYVPPAYRPYGVANSLLTSAKLFAASRRASLYVEILGKGAKDYGIDPKYQIGAAYAYGLGD